MLILVNQLLIQLHIPHTEPPARAIPPPPPPWHHARMRRGARADDVREGDEAELDWDREEAVFESLVVAADRPPSHHHLYSSDLRLGMMLRLELEMVLELRWMGKSEGRRCWYLPWRYAGSGIDDPGTGTSTSTKSMVNPDIAHILRSIRVYLDSAWQALIQAWGSRRTLNPFALLGSRDVPFGGSPEGWSGEHYQRVVLGTHDIERHDKTHECNFSKGILVAGFGVFTAGERGIRGESGARGERWGMGEKDTCRTWIGWYLHRLACKFSAPDEYPIWVPAVIDYSRPVQAVKLADASPTIPNNERSSTTEAGPKAPAGRSYYIIDAQGFRRRRSATTTFGKLYGG
ncbi:hypothetical protein BU17DRAFT_70223 [Hysterangium stoloniferum]|nr:hypothetical protein BU17DRAFT_70223 [Hysterangium stoloniferum]